MPQSRLQKVNSIPNDGVSLFTMSWTSNRRDFVYGQPIERKFMAFNFTTKTLFNGVQHNIVFTTILLAPYGPSLMASTRVMVLCTHILITLLDFLYKRTSLHISNVD